MAADFRDFANLLVKANVGSRAVDLWRFLEPGALPLESFGKVLNDEARAQPSRGSHRALLGYSMGGRLALHALLEKDHPWQAAVIISAHPGLKNIEERRERSLADAEWAKQALLGNWQTFLEAWNAQPILGTVQPRDPQASNQLALHRREISRSFVDWSLGMQASLWSRLTEISVPVLWIAGENDLKFRNLAQLAVSAMPRAQLLIAPEAGHRIPWEQPAWLAEQVADFLKGKTFGRNAD